MPPLHRPSSAFDHFLGMMREECPQWSMTVCVERTLDLLSQRVEGLPEVELSPVLPSDAPEPDDFQALVVFMAQAMMLRTALSEMVPGLLRLFANPENLDIDYLVQEDDFGEVLEKPVVQVWAEVSGEGNLELYWDDSEDEGYLETPTPDPESERENRVLSLPASMWKAGLPPDASAAQREMARLIPHALLHGLLHIMECLDATCDLHIDEWPLLVGDSLKFEDSEERYFRHLFEQAAAARRTVAVVTAAANKALGKHGLANVKQFTELRKTHKAGKALAAAIAECGAKPCSVTDVAQLSEYVRHVDDAGKLLRALTAVARQNGISKAELDAYKS